MAAPAPHLEGYIKNWNRIHKQSTALMATAPDDKYDWKTCDSAMTLGELMNHLWQAEVGLVEAVLTGNFPKEFPAAKKTTAELLATFDQAHEECVAKVAALTPEQLGETVAPFGPDKAMSRQALLHAMHEHEIHHRGQLYTYLRILGVEVPPLFG
ncbi:MAG TPA: DinB family protein [Blastocatellia bacterium]|nr:DinB family protein [Blastocatellia bacterium]